MVSIRGVLFILDENDIIPLMIFLKKDKKYWKNVNWNEYKGFIWDEYDNALVDIEKWEFEEF
jgi:hypothetical protein